MVPRDLSPMSNENAYADMSVKKKRGLKTISPSLTRNYSSKSQSDYASPYKQKPFRHGR